MITRADVPRTGYRPIGPPGLTPTVRPRAPLPSRPLPPRRLSPAVDQQPGSGHYRNDWSWDWSALLQKQGIDASIYVASLNESRAARTIDGFRVRFLSLSSNTARGCATRCTNARRSVASWVKPRRDPEAAPTALADDRIDVLCVQEYWTARFDVLARALSVPVVAVDQGLPDRHEVKLLKRGSVTRASRVIVQTAEEAEKGRSPRREGGANP